MIIVFILIIITCASTTILSFYQHWLKKKAIYTSKSASQHIVNQGLSVSIVESENLMFPVYSAVKNRILVKDSMLSSKHYFDIFVVLHELGHAKFSESFKLDNYMEKIFQPCVVLNRIILLPYFFTMSIIVAFGENLSPLLNTINYISLAVFFIGALYRAFIVFVHEWKANSFALDFISNCDDFSAEFFTNAKRLAWSNYLFQIMWYLLALLLVIFFFALYNFVS